MRVESLGLVDYRSVMEAMTRFTAERDQSTPDVLWLCQHPPTYTTGVGHTPVSTSRTGAAINVVQSQRGGDITYHGPGQIVAYPLIDLKRLGIYIKEYVFRLEESVIRTLNHYQLVGHRVAGAPGVYTRLDNPFDHSILHAHATHTQATTGITTRRTPIFDGLGKIAALGIKVSQGRAYHGLALNVQMDLQPFTDINPCGYQHLRTVDMHTMGVDAPIAEVMDILALQLQQRLSI